MKRPFVLWLTALILGIAGSTHPALAQTIGGAPSPSGPAISPYLNLMRPATLPGINYYGLVQPQMQFQSAISNLQQNQASLLQTVTTGGAGADQPLTTGHPAAFGNYLHYYPMRGTSGFGTLPGQQNLQNQRMMYSPLRGLGGAGTSTGLGGLSTGGMGPGVRSGGLPR